ncbi:hypothetical protein BurJ1DRAFT_0527 [Burkholderiales bacterium JOSHI_001]|nr:hypothetical protein BurJ1DRAFT_0527 [Burkholderiales bacterium JOSHI_001]
MSPAPHPVLDAVLQVMRPLARLLLRQGIGYPVLAAALKRVFLDAAQAELAARGMPATDSAITLLCGVHRRDVRLLTRVAPDHQRAAASAQPLGVAGQVVGAWLTDERWLDPQGAPRRLARTGEDGFDALAQGISRDVRPRALLDELLRLELVQEGPDGGVTLARSGFAPRGDAAEMAAQMAANLHDHAAAAVANLAGEANFLDQALYVDDIGADSLQQLRRAATAAWRQAFKAVLSQGRALSAADVRQLPQAQRSLRLRFGAYFFSEDTQAPPPSPARGRVAGPPSEDPP